MAGYRANFIVLSVYIYIFIYLVLDFRAYNYRLGNSEFIKLFWIKKNNNAGIMNLT
jgi:hypothetical protein